MSDTATPQNEEINCPFCKKTKINVTITPEHYNYHSARAFGKTKMIPVVHPEKIEVHSKCPNCGKSKQEIKEAVKSGTISKQTHEELLERLKKAGLPTKIETKH